MPNWNGLVLTKKGQLLQAKVGTGVVLALTKMKLGSGVLPEGTSLEDLTDLVTPEQNVGIAAKEVLTDQKMCKISATITNVGLSAGYYVRELGVFANDPDDGEILYAVTSDSAPDYLPPEGGAISVSQEFAVYIAVNNASEVKVSIDSGALATMGYVQLAINTHNEDPDAHTAVIDKHNKDENAHNGILQKVATLGESVLQKLALTTTISAINALQTNSWFGQLLKMVLTASGVRYNIEQNGYICLGSFFGGLIIQWGIASPANANDTYAEKNFPISFKSAVSLVASWDIQDEVTTAAHTTTVTWNRQGTSLSKIRLITDTTEIGIMGFLAVGR